MNQDQFLAFKGLKQYTPEVGWESLDAQGIQAADTCAQQTVFAGCSNERPPRPSRLSNTLALLTRPALKPNSKPRKHPCTTVPHWG